jgi:hypothetical protein
MRISNQGFSPDIPTPFIFPCLSPARFTLSLAFRPDVHTPTPAWALALINYRFCMKVWIKSINQGKNLPPPAKNYHSKILQLCLLLTSGSRRFGEPTTINPC